MAGNMTPTSGHVLFVSAGMLSPKRRDHLLARRQINLNYGALTLASQLDLSGIRAVLVHGAHVRPDQFLVRLMDAGLLNTPYPIMLSLPSFHSLEWAQQFCRLLKASSPQKTIVAGGRWVTTPDPEWLRLRIPELDRIVSSLGERVVGELVGMMGGEAVNDAAPPPFPLNHWLVEGFEDFQPNIEASRGCGQGCAFCEERAIRLSKLRAPEVVADFIELAQRQYAGAEIQPYLQSSFFAPNVRWASGLSEEVAKRGLNVRWRCETRVDAMSPEVIGHLAAAGLKVIDLGLETASPQQILAMNKSRDPDAYLRNASELLEACKRFGVWAKVNVLLYAGETARTVEETWLWLDHHASAIKGVSVGPVIVYGPPSQSVRLVRVLEGQGARVVDHATADIRGITNIHLSTSLDAEDAEAISLETCRRYMTKEDYFDLKAFSYYPRGYSKADFETDLNGSKRANLPFSLPAERPDS